MSAKEVTVVTIKGFPSELHRRLRIRAAIEGTTSKAIVEKAVDEYIRRKEATEKKAR